jgi:uncharacterized membrane protein
MSPAAGTIAADDQKLSNHWNQCHLRRECGTVWIIRRARNEVDMVEKKPISGHRNTGPGAGKEEAQKRADRVRSFREELEQLEREQILILAEEQRQSVAAYHTGLLADLAGMFDVDTTNAQKQLTIGLRIVSFLGAAAISAAVFFFFCRFWGVLSASVQVGILVALPILCTFGIELAARKEKTLYFASLAGLVAFTAFVMNLSMLGQIFNITPTQNAFLVWAVFAFILAYTYGLRILLAAGILSLSGYLAATTGTWAGCYWLDFGERPENFIVAGIVLFAISFIPHRQQEGFPFYYRLFGLLQVLIAVLILADWGRLSYLALAPVTVEHAYQVAGFIISGLVVWLGIGRQWPAITNLGSTFFAIFLYTKLYDWWWRWMPKYIFFLDIGIVAILLLLALKRLRFMSRKEA